MKTESAPLTLRDTLENHQVQIYFGAVILGALAALSISGTTALEIGINPSLAFMLFVTFLQVPLAELRMALAQFRFLGVLLLANFVVMPMLVGVLVPFLPCSATNKLRRSVNQDETRPQRWNAVRA